ncbi:TIR domain-containing protein [Humibacter ginsenosidimutans]|uniref:TIR domain-containing protein n=1 Tax=Humibacter ginsenosidimutans TaxID=2599293 RepID=A0A5B8M282_9MICO|nr:TIR domain-containing protein [Humibacter ginsenosidimutans]QDZ14473.1 TIR domain-containing protein [Humibacter ginsenosidimutans]
MALLRVEEVFKTSGIPTHTFVRPSEYSRLRVALRTPGRGVIVEGPSGIGKSTAITRALEEEGLDKEVTRLTAREPVDVEYLDALPELGAFGTVVIDDFHRLEESVKRRIADLLKVTADAEDESRKLVIIGINEAGKSLIDSSPDLTNRLEVLRFEAEPDLKIDELVTAGERAFNVSLAARALIVQNARGSFYIAQLLCMDACLQADLTERPEESVEVATTYAAIQRKVVERQRDRFGDSVRSFARGTRFRPGGRAPYLHILRWLSEADSWSISIRDEIRRHPTEKASVFLVLDRGYLASLVAQPAISKLLHFDEKTSVLSVEDPMLTFYLRAVSWPDFVREVGFKRVDYEESYDIALSFAGEDRAYASALRDALEDLGHAVFYDSAEQARFLGQDVETYLGPIYESGSRYVVAVLGEMYGRKRWTLFEASKYKDRIEAGQVIPVWSIKIPPEPFDATRSLFGLDWDPDAAVQDQASAHASVISEKLGLAE